MMNNNKKHTYEDISPDHLSWKTWWILGNGTIGKNITSTLHYTLGMNFLLKQIPVEQYNHPEVKHFCDQLKNLFMADWLPYIAEKWSNWDESVSFAYDAPIQHSQKKDISRFVAQTLLDQASFANKREYYILNNWLQNMQRAHEIIDNAWYSDLWYWISLATFETAKSHEPLDAGEIIKDDVASLYTKAAHIAEENSMSKSLGKYSFDQYLARLKYFGHDIRTLYDAEITAANPKPWKLAILSSLIAYQTTDVQEFYRMIMRKLWHIEQITQSFRSSYPKNIQKWLIMWNQQANEHIYYNFNKKLLEWLQKTFYTGDDFASEWKIDDERAADYKDNFFGSLLAVSNDDLQPTDVNWIIELEQEYKDYFDDAFKERDPEMIQWMIAELRKHNRDYSLALDTEELAKQEIFTMSDEELIEYIEEAPIWLLKCCAIWLYVLNSTSLMEFSDRCERYVDILLKHSDFCSDAEESLNETYQALIFSNLWPKVEIQAMLVVLRKRIDAIRLLIVNTEEVHTSHIDSYDTEYQFVLHAYDMLEDQEKMKMWKTLLIDRYEEIIQWYKDNMDDNDDDAEEHSF